MENNWNAAKLIKNLRPMYVKEIIFEYTDEDNFLTVGEISDKLVENYGITVTRQTLYDDIDMLISAGYDIECVKGRMNQYHVLSREFDNAELRILIDSVESMQSLPRDQASSLIKKIAKLGGPSADYLIQTVNVDGRPRSDNTQIKYIIDTVYKAILKKRQIAFKYYEHLTSTEKVLKNNGKEYKVSPYRLVSCNNFYYLLGLPDDSKKVMIFRVDRISGIPAILKMNCRPEPDTLYINRYIKETFHMKGGEAAEIVLTFDGEVMDAMVDRFGQDMEITHINKSEYRAKVNVQVNNIFFAWVFGFEGKVRISAPTAIQTQYIKMISKEMARL